MRRFHVRLGGTLPLAFGFTFGQDAHEACEAVELFCLPRHDVGQVIDGAGQVGDAFFGL